MTQHLLSIRGLVGVGARSETGLLKLLYMSSVSVKRKLPDWILACKKKKRKIVVIFNERFVRDLVDCIESAVEMLSMGREYRIEHFFEDKMSDFHFMANCGLWNVLDMNLVLKGVEYLSSEIDVRKLVEKVAHSEKEVLDLLMQTLEEIRHVHFWQIHLMGR